MLVFTPSSDYCPEDEVTCSNTPRQVHTRYYSSFSWVKSLKGSIRNIHVSYPSWYCYFIKIHFDIIEYPSMGIISRW